MSNEIRLQIRKITNLEKHNINKSDIKLVIPKDVTLRQLIDALPKKTHNCEPFGLSIMVANSNEWQCKYFTHYSNKSDDRFATCIAKSPETAVRKMLNEFIRLGFYKSLNVKVI